jgi:hypothetical protein
VPLAKLHENRIQSCLTAWSLGGAFADFAGDFYNHWDSLNFIRHVVTRGIVFQIHLQGVRVSVFCDTDPIDAGNRFKQLNGGGFGLANFVQ